MCGKYVAYVGSYTRKKARGITIYDVDAEKGRMKFRREVAITNPSYLKIDPHRRVLYSIEDAGITAFKILDNGDIERINTVGINGMRGCFIDVDSSGEYVYVAGYHDGKITMLSLTEYGGISRITDEVYLKGLGKPYEENYRPHVSCCKLTPFEKYLCVADLSVDNYKVYAINREYGKLTQVSLIPCELKSDPREIVFSQTGRFAYTVCTRNKQIEAFEYQSEDKAPVFRSIQKLQLLGKGMSVHSAPYALTRSHDGTFLVASIVEDNSVSFINRDKETGRMSFDFNLPISGDFPKDIQLFPNDRFLASVNHDSHQVTLFKVDREKKTLTMTQRPVDVEYPNCIRFCSVKE
ncbi:MAG: beta-propeller fold lactonase family protein [Eubacteriales bacterium]|nr:beta-propeller fold lactonase family protein [Eubacteriales bacterium]